MHIEDNGLTAGHGGGGDERPLEPAGTARAPAPLSLLLARFLCREVDAR